jgi:hypothetical protein
MNVILTPAFEAASDDVSGSDLRSVLVALRRLRAGDRSGLVRVSTDPPRHLRLLVGRHFIDLVEDGDSFFALGIYRQ